MLEGGSAERAELEVLGFKLERLTERLSQEWKLSNLLERTLRDKNDTDPRIRSIKLGCAIARASENGWGSHEVARAVKEVSYFLRITETETTEMLHAAAREAAEVTESYGTKKISRLVPVPGEAGSEKSGRAAEHDMSVELSKNGETKMNGLAARGRKISKAGSVRPAGEPAGFFRLLWPPGEPR